MPGDAASSDRQIIVLELLLNRVSTLETERSSTVLIIFTKIGKLHIMKTILTGCTNFSRTGILMKTFYRFRQITFLALALLVNSCSVRNYIVRSTFGAGGNLAEVYLSDDDPELVREAMPSNLKLIEMLLGDSPNNSELLLAAVQSFTMYAYAFVQQDMDRVADEDIRQADKIRKRLRGLYSRAKNYGFRALEVRYPGFGHEYDVHPQKTLQHVERKDVSLLYWTAAAWGGLITSAKSDPEVMIDFPHIGYFLDRALELDDDFSDGALHEMMISYLMATPDAGDSAAKEARKHFERAVELTHGERASVYVTFAESVSVKTQNREEFLDLLDRALRIDADRNPSNRLANIIAQERAQWLKERVEELFF